MTAKTDFKRELDCYSARRGRFDLVGPFDAEAETPARMHDEFIPAGGLRMTGRHHEIYLSDPRRTAPERLRTILRQPVA
jgi:hypothetical protein